MGTVRCSRQGAVWVVSPEGALEGQLVDEFRGRVTEALSSGTPRIVVDLEKVKLVNSVALEALLDAQEDCRARGGDLKLCRLNELLRDVLRITGLDTRFETFDNVPAAIGSFAQ